MTIEFNHIIYIIIIGIIGLFCFSGLYMWYKIKTESEIGKKVKGNTIAISKLKGELRNITSEGQELPANIPDNLANLKNLSLEQAMELFGVDSKEINNPLVKPLAQKVWNGFQNFLSDKQEQEGGEEGY